MLAALLWTLAALLVLALLVVLLPVGVKVVAQSAPGAFLRVEVRPLGPVAPWIRVLDSRRARDRPAGEPRTEPAREHPGRPHARRKKVDSARAMAALPDLVRGLLAVFRLEKFEVEAIFGLGDPADTGSVYGAVVPPLVAAGCAVGRPHAVRLTPDFGRAVIEGRAEAEITVRPARAIAPAVRFAWAVFGPRR